MFWLNSTGPMIGMSDSTGIGSLGSRNRWFRSGFSVSTVEKKNVVRPSTSTFSTTPTMIWSTQYLTLKNTRSEEHTSELQSRGHLVCRLLLEKKIVSGNELTRAISTLPSAALREPTSRTTHRRTPSASTPLHAGHAATAGARARKETPHGQRM